jgi:DNA-damage-inducible protein J
MITISIRLDDDLKAELDEMCEEMGLNLTTFFTLYAKKAVRDRKIPFEITAPKDSFYSETNMKRLQSSLEQLRDGKVVVKSMEELEAMTDG